MNCKSQVIGSVFAYLFSAVVIIAILIAGYKYLYITQDTLKQSQMQALKNSLSSDIKSISSDYGSSKKVSYILSEGTELCLFDLEKKDDILSNEKINSYPLIKNSLESNIRKNAFLIGASAFEPIYISEIEIKQPYFHCIKPIAGKVSFVIEGLGNRTLISVD